MKSLFDTAKVFLIQSLLDFEDGRLAFSILHAVTATELLLKERLSLIHQNLIYGKIDSRQITQENTVGLKDLPQRLINLGIELSQEERDVINRLAKWRHEIVHHMPTYSEQHAVINLGLLYDFLSQFLDREMHLTFNDVIPKSSYKTANRLLKEWAEVTTKAKKEAEAEGHLVDVALECPVCGVAGVISLRGKQAFCHLCDTNLLFGECPLCHKPAIDTGLFFDDKVYHPKCWHSILENQIKEKEAQA